MALVGVHQYIEQINYPKHSIFCQEEHRLIRILGKIA